ncbi:MAG: phytanoyl-CoA dioxygenase family protein [bacterium]|nr:phytanoyl-CoA dioxygenase family protein [Gammaproteobacteria bacterium]
MMRIASLSTSLTTSLARTLRGPDEPGFQLFSGFTEPSMGTALLDDVTAIARASAAGQDVSPAVVMPENQVLQGSNPEDIISKIFRLHRRPLFLEFLNDQRVCDIVLSAIGQDVDCFLSQFIFKNPGAWGQPWHQDSYYFPFEPARPIIGLWLAITEATLENGCLHILPGSQREPVKQHIPDRREGANYGYVEIVDHDMSQSNPCLLQAGDLMVFDSHLMHRSTDNISKGIRAAMVWHFAAAGTKDPGIKNRSGQQIKNPINDWMPYIRQGRLLL